MPLLIVSIAVVLVLAALFAAVEASIFSTSYPRSQVLKRQKKPGSHALAAIRENMSRPITTLVIGTNVTTIAGSLYIGHVATEAYGNSAIGVVSATVTFLVIVFGEIFPKVLGERFAEPIALTASGPLLFLTNVLSPVIWIIEHLSRPFVNHSRKIVSEEELKMLSEIGSREGSIKRDEDELIRRVFTLNDMTAHDIMTPWKVVDTLQADMQVQETMRIMDNKPYSRYPVLDAQGVVAGVTHTKDLLTMLAKDQGAERVRSLMAPVRFVSQDRKVDDLLGAFLSSRQHLFIVRDAAGKPVGVVTFEDVLEQLVGEIVDETDEVVDLRKGI